MKKLFAFSLTLLSTAAMTMAATIGRCGMEMPRFDWIRAEVQKIINGPSAETIDVQPDLNNLTQSQVHSVSGHFTNREKMQQILCIPAKSKAGKNLGWETNLWLLIECDSADGYKTVATSRGDLVYGSSLVDIDGDGLMEVPMINEYTEACGTKVVTYKLFSFKTMGFLYESSCKDQRKTLFGDRKCKKISKGTQLYGLLTLDYKDVDNDGDLEIIENWISFQYNGGKTLRQVELQKTMSSQTRILYLRDGMYKS